MSDTPESKPVGLCTERDLLAEMIDAMRRTRGLKMEAGVIPVTQDLARAYGRILLKLGWAVSHEFDRDMVGIELKYAELNREVVGIESKFFKNVDLHVVYFKPSGKFYTSARASVPHGVGSMEDIKRWFKARQDEGRAPGLSGGGKHFNTVIDVSWPPEFPAYPLMIPAQSGD